MKNFIKENKGLILLILIIIFCICSISYSKVYDAPAPPKYAGKYDAEVYVNGKYDKKMSANSVLILNDADSQASLVVNGVATNKRWREVEDGIKVGSKTLERVDAHTLTYKQNGIKVIFKQEVFTSDN